MTDEEIKEIEGQWRQIGNAYLYTTHQPLKSMFAAVKEFDTGFPNNMIGNDPHLGPTPLTITSGQLGKIDYVQASQAI